MGCAGYAGDGWLLPLEGKLFTIVFDVVAQTPLFGVYNGVQQSRALSMNGLMLGAGLDVARTMVTLGIDLAAITTRGTLQSGIAYALAVSGSRLPHRAAGRPNATSATNAPNATGARSARRFNSTG